jgi:type I restriction enzyme S subunit
MGQTILKEDLVDDGDVTVFSATESGTTFGRINNPSVLLDAGDIVIPARGVSIGHALLVTEPATCTQTTIYSKLMDRSQIFPRYVLYFMLGYRRVLFYYDRTAIPQITVEQVSANPLLVPPPDEQRAIAEFLDRETARINRLIVIVGDAIGRLKELRNALISAAVTGKIDVRGEAP